MNLNDLQSLQNTGIHLAFKVGILAILILFILFLLVVIKQIRSMNKILTQDDLFPMLQLLSFVLIAGVVVLFVVAIVIL